MVVCMILASVIFIIFAWLFMTADENILGALSVCSQEIAQENIANANAELSKLINELRTDLKNKKKINKAKSLKKKIDGIQKQLEAWQKGKINVFDMIPIAGYRIIQLKKWDATNPTIKELNHKCCHFKEKKEAINYAYYLLASMYGYFLFGAMMFFLILGITTSLHLGARSAMIAVAALAVFILVGYIPYDNVNVVLQKRSEEIEVEFPQAVSKLALLTVAGMEVSQAWKLTAESKDGTLYEEMRRVDVAFDNNVLPTEAYTRFMDRCDNKYTTKLATAILQNLSKGNSEIVQLFRTLNDESWMEFKHSARRMGEKIQSKLLIPTLLMFVGILIMIIIPIMTGFSL